MSGSNNRGNLFARISWLSSASALASIASPALSQSATLTPAPIRQTVDDNGVDLFQGTMNAATPPTSIGPDGDIVYRRQYLGNRYLDSVTGFIAATGSTYTVSIGGEAEQFTLSGTTFSTIDSTGSTLTRSGSFYTYTSSDGTKYVFYQDYSPYFIYTGLASGIMLHTVTKTDGEVINYYYRDQQVPVGITAIVVRRLQSISTSKLHFLQLTYQADTITTQSQIPSALNLVKVAGYNLNVDACSPTANACTAATPRPSATFSGVNTFSDAQGRTTTYTFGPNGLSAIRLPGSSADDMTVSYSGDKVSAVTNFGVPTAYSYADSTSERTVTTTRGGTSRTFKFDLSSGLLTYFANELGKVTRYEYIAGAVSKITQPEGNAIIFVRDTRGNATSTTYKAKPGSGLADIVTSASYPCTNVAACNQPATTTDALGHVTDYSYDVSGNLTSVKGPAPTSGGDRPETRYTYTLAGGITQLSTISTCSAGSAPACIGSAAETKTTFAYDSNFRSSLVTRAAGDGSISATTANGYDPAGNLISQDGPLSGTDDTIYFEYDGTRSLTASIGSDPDGPGGRKRPTTRFHYDNRGLVDTVTLGVIDAPGGTFSASLVTTSTYDANRRRTSHAVSAGGTTYKLTQFSYDALGRPDCTAVRMNPTAFVSLPASACVAGTAGGDGPDRITRVTSYDSAGRPREVSTAYGTSDASVEKTDYTDNGKIRTLTDAENNLTSYIYDGFDRLSVTQFPATTKGAGASTSGDYEQLGYDANGAITSRRLRDGTTIAYAYDGLGRVATKTLPGTEPAVVFSYDLADRLKSASTTLHSVTLDWDALGRQTSEAGPLGTIGYQYDPAGNRTRITWPDGAVTGFTYDTAGAMLGIYEGAGISTLMTSYGYDDLGRRTSMATRYGAGTSFSYDAVSRLSGLSQGFANPADNVSFGFSYNPAGQIGSRTSSNDSYSWTGAVNVDRDYTATGLNQYTAAGSTSFAYDARGNLTTSGSSAYGYSAENLLTSASGATLSYDPLGRLYQVSSGGTVTRFQYIGGQIAAEYDGGGTRLRRYIPGPGGDEPSFAYEGPGLTAPKWFHVDERGSVIATSDAGAARSALASYDEFGIPQDKSGDVGRFRYTGQVFLPAVGLYYYKARMYSPTLGRFMQTDPTGYADGLNWYNYTGSDPVNGTDPNGTGDDIVVYGNRCHSSDPDEIVVCGGGGKAHPNGMSQDEYTRYYGGPSSAPASAPGAGASPQAAPQAKDPRCNNTAAVDFVKAHRSDAAAVAKSLNLPTEMILGLSAQESQWGTGRIANTANNYFSQHASARVPYQIATIPSLKDGPMSRFASYETSARSFAAMYGNAVRGITDPTAFGQALVRANFNTGNSKTGGRDDFVSYLAGIINDTKRRMKCP